MHAVLKLSCLIAICGRSVAPAQNTRELKGIVVGEDGKPVAGVEVALTSGPKILVLNKKPARTLTDAEGQFTIPVPSFIFRLRSTASHDDGKLLASMKLPGNPKDWPNPFKVELKPARTIEIMVVNDRKEPLPDVDVGFTSSNLREIISGKSDKQGRFVTTIAQGLDVSDVYAWSREIGIDYRSFVIPTEQRGDKKAKKPEVPNSLTLVLGETRPLRVRVIDDAGQPVPDIPIRPWLLNKKGEPDHFNLGSLFKKIEVRSDKDGIAEFKWLPAWDTNRVITFFGGARNYAGERLDYEVAKGKPPIFRLTRLTFVTGTIRKPDGTPAPRIVISFKGVDYSFSEFERTAYTNDQGQYKVQLGPGRLYLGLVQNPEFTAPPQTGFEVKPGETVKGLDFQLEPVIPVTGRITIGRDRTPVPNKQIDVYQYGPSIDDIDFKLPNPANSQRSIQPYKIHHARTDKNGDFIFRLGPGKFDIRGPRGSVSEDFELVSKGKGREFNYHRMRADRGVLRGFVTLAKPIKPVPNASIIGVYRNPSVSLRNLRAETASTGRFEVQRSLHRMTLYARNEDNTLAGVVEIGPDDRSKRIALHPVAKAVGRLIDVEGKPVGDRKIKYGIRIYESNDSGSAWSSELGGIVTTDANGRFQIAGLVLGQQYVITSERGPNVFNPIVYFRATRSDTFDLGDVVFPKKRMRIHERLRVTDSAYSADKRLASAIATSRFRRTGTLLVLTDPKRYGAAGFYGAITGYSGFTKAWIPTTGPSASEAHDLAKRLGVELDELLTLIVVDSDEKVLGSITSRDLWDGDEEELKEAPLAKFMQKHTIDRPDCEELLAAALEEAQRDGKRVLLLQMGQRDSSLLVSEWLDQHRDAIEKDFVWLALDRDWSGGEMFEDLRGEDRFRTPWLAVMNSEGKIATSINDIPGERDSRLWRMAPRYDKFLRSIAKKLELSDIEIMIDDLQNP